MVEKKLCKKCGVNQAPKNKDECRSCRKGISQEFLLQENNKRNMALNFINKADSVKVDKPNRFKKVKERHHVPSIVREYKKRNRGYKSRFVPQDIWNRVKSRKVCDFCKKPFVDGERKAVHHEIPMVLGGTHDEENLRCVHKKGCHAKADEESFKKYSCVSKEVVDKYVQSNP